MCNAYSLTHPRDEMMAYARDLAKGAGLMFEPGGLPEDWRTRYRISPRQTAPVLRLDEQGRIVWSMALWGFLVKGGKPGFAPTNARDDKLVQGWPWKMVSKSQRCLVLCDGFFEPEKPAGVKGTVPWCYYAMGNRQLFAMAGLCNTGPDPKTAEDRLSYTVVTTGASDIIVKHNRMPAILEDDALARWLKPGPVPAGDLGPYPGKRMTGFRVMDEARNSRIPDHAGMIEPITEIGDLFG